MDDAVLWPGYGRNENAGNRIGDGAIRKGDGGG